MGRNNDEGMDYQLDNIRWYRANGIAFREADRCYDPVCMADVDGRLDRRVVEKCVHGQMVYPRNRPLL